MSCEKKLANLIADNFITYFKTQVYHFNIVGPDFPQYHGMLFSEVYSYLYENHDDLNEQLRQMGYLVPTSLEIYLSATVIKPNAVEKNSKEMLSAIAKDLNTLQMSAQKLYEEAGLEGHGGLETYIGDYIAGISKLKWKVESCLK